MTLKSAVVIPVWRNFITDMEKISLCQCCDVLSKHVIYIATFKELDIYSILSFFNKKHVDYRVIFFKKSCFLDRERYNQLLLSLYFYSRFIFYKYILIYQLDCFVFRDELERWTSSGYSYIGAPWLDGYDTAVHGSKVLGVGNGGLSLRCVADHLRVLLSFKRIKEPEGNTFFLLNNFTENEDVFWSDIAGKNFSWFKIPDWKIAAQFSVEVQPRYFFEVNNHTLPFGCHAWWRYDLEFWKPHIEQFGYKLPPR